MRLRRLAIDRLPGIDEPFTLEELGDGLHVIVGPNGIGKSSLCRAARALLWTEHGPEERVTANALFDGEGARWRVERDGSHHRWQRDGTESAPPPLPVAHLDGCFFLVLRDLLDTSSDAGSDVAAQIRRRMSGGFDIHDVSTRLFGPPASRPGQKERRDLEQAEIRVRKAGSRHEEIARQEARLQGLEGELVGAETARRKLDQIDTALEVHGLRGDLARVTAELDALPDSLERLTGDALTPLDQREAELESGRRRRGELELELQAARDAAARTRLEAPVGAAALATWQARAGALTEAEARLEHAQEEWKARQREVEVASRALGGRAEAPPELELDAAADLFAFLRAATSAEDDVNALRRRIELLEGRTLSDTSRRRLTLLRQGVTALRAWLRAPGPTGHGSATGRRTALAAAAVALVTSGTALGLWIHQGYGLLAVAGLGLAATLWLLRPDPRTGYARDAARRGFPSGLEPPSSWTGQSATRCLCELESELAELEAAAQRARDRDVERASLETQLRAAEERLPELERRRRELASGLGLATIPPDAELVDMAHALASLRQARRVESVAQERAREIAHRHRARLLELSRELGALGEAPAPDAASARAAIDHLRQRDSELAAARATEASARLAIDRLEAELARLEHIVQELYEKAGLETGDRAGLARLLEDLPRQRQLKRKRDGLVARIDHAESRLAGAGELELARRDRGELEVEKGQLERRLTGIEKLRDQIADIRAEARRAREGHDLEDALAGLDLARGRLRLRRDWAMRAAAGHLLLETVEREHETDQMPRVLERAKGLFGAFTHHAYDLRVAPDASGSFVAVETRSGAGRRPHELSDGTRAQLLLAARLAFAGEAERGARVPLFLDEALDQSDPVRFRAIARSLGRIVEDEGRQIFYLTNDPADGKRIEEALAEEGCAPPRLIDLAAIRGRAASVPGPDVLRLEPLPEVPEPGSHTPETYGAALRVPPLDPRREASASHLLYLLWDDLPLLHRLLESRIEWVGQWSTLSRSQAPLSTRIAAEDGAGSQLDARAGLLEEFCLVWREGRGRPVDRDALERSGAVSGRYLDGVVEVTGELASAGERLIEALRARDDERLHGFRSKATDSLEAFLTEEGYIDPRPILDEPALLARVLATPAAAPLPEPAAAQWVSRWWRLAVSSAS